MNDCITRTCEYPNCDKPVSSKRARTCSRAHAAALRKMTQASMVEDKCADNLRECAHPGCGNMFVPLRKNQKYCMEQHYNTCENCGNRFKVKTGPRSAKACSAHCATVLGHTDESQEKRRRNSLEEWGVETPLQAEEVKRKIKKTLDENPDKDYRIGTSNFDGVLKAKYGEEVTNASQIDEVKERKSETVREHYGVDNPMQSPIVKAKVAETNMERYGTSCAMALPEHQMKAIEANRALYGVDRPFQNPDRLRLALDALAKSEHGGAISKVNRKFADGLKSVGTGVDIVFEHPIPDSNRRIDIMASKGTRKVFIDLNPTISHNSAFSYESIVHREIADGLVGGVCNDDAVPRNYSYERAHMMMEEFPFDDYIQIWDWDDNNSMIMQAYEKLESGHQSYSARKLAMRRVSQYDANELLRLWHPQGPAKGQSVCLVLEDPMTNEPLMVATFGKPRFNKQYDWEWIRTAVKPGTQIHGGQSLVFKRFLTDNHPSSVISYIDFSKTTTRTTFLNHCGFIETEPTGPTLMWSFKNRCIPETSLLKIGADRVLGTHYGSREDCGMDNHAIMLNEGWLPVWTAGNRVFTWHDDK